MSGGAVTLGLPSKGRLMDAAFDWLAAHGLCLERSADGRAYAATAPEEGLDIALLSAAEIPQALASGRLHLGITGEDVVRERVPDWARHVVRLERLGFGHADLVVAVPAFWVDVETMSDLDDVAARFRARHGHGLRIATKYPALAREFFHRKGVADYRLIDSLGATEAAPRNLAAEAIVDITTTGATLRANQLRVLEDGLILRSEACLWLSRATPLPALGALARRLGVTLPE